MLLHVLELCTDIECPIPYDETFTVKPALLFHVLELCTDITKYAA